MESFLVVLREEGGETVKIIAKIEHALIIAYQWHAFPAYAARARRAFAVIRANIPADAPSIRVADPKPDVAPIFQE